MLKMKKEDFSKFSSKIKKKKQVTDVTTVFTVPPAATLHVSADVPQEYAGDAPTAGVTARQLCSVLRPSRLERSQDLVSCCTVSAHSNPAVCPPPHQLKAQQDKDRVVGHLLEPTEECQQAKPL